MMLRSLTSRDLGETSLGDRLRLARVAAGLSTRTLAERLGTRFGLSHATLANYERGVTKPSMGLVTAVANELGRPLQWFLQSGRPLRNVRYRNRKSLVTQTACMQFEFAAQTWLDAYVFVERRLNEPLSNVQKHNPISFRGRNAEKAAKSVRDALELKPEDPVHSISKVMEIFGIRAIEVATKEAIDGLAALYGNEYVTVLARGLKGDRSRMNAAHEFGHFIAGDVDAETPEQEADTRAFEFGSHLLMPSSVLKKAVDRRSIVHLVEIKQLYGVSLAAMIYRAEKAKYISTSEAKNIWIEFAKRGWRQQEPGRIPPDRALRFEILFERAIKLEKVTLDEVSVESGLSVVELKRRLSEPAGFADENVDLVDRQPAHGLRLVSNK